MAKKWGFRGSTITVGLVLLVSGCSGASVGVLAPPEEAVLAPVVGVTPAGPTEGVIRCAVAWDGVSVCWQVKDSVTVVGPR